MSSFLLKKKKVYPTVMFGYPLLSNRYLPSCIEYMKISYRISVIIIIDFVFEITWRSSSKSSKT